MNLINEPAICNCHIHLAGFHTFENLKCGRYDGQRAISEMAPLKTFLEFGSSRMLGGK
jgi:hypothetical protein